MNATTPLDLSSYWMPFTHNRYFKQRPKLVASGRGSYLTLTDGRRVFDCLSGLWCTPMGHCAPQIVQAIQEQVAGLDYTPGFQLSHPGAFELATRIAELAPAPLNRVFFANSGSEAVDTALKIAIGYHRLRGEASRTRLIGRERGYHGVGLGGTSVGGISPNRKMFAPLMISNVDHLPHTHNLAHMQFTRGQPAWGAHLADELERIVALHDASTIAAVIVEPMQGSAGVIVPPKGYLQRLREICDRHGILLIFDEVITGFGRVGANFGSQRLGVTPDLICFAKAVTNGVVPFGGVIAKQSVYDTFMTGPAHAIELFHGYTYSGHPLACAAGNATLKLMQETGAIKRAAMLEPVLEHAMHSLREEPHVNDIRNFGLAAALELKPRDGQPGMRAMEMFERGLDAGILLRFTGDTLAVAPPFISTEDEIELMVARIRELLRELK
ncbi:MAG: aspartate aminotransferase family protein [Proteobacteria bacterium]|nr:aspartate aminotransferase family protein [Pseudomonadota bacterium]